MDEYIIDIEKDDIPYRSQFIVNNNVIELAFKYNALMDLFTVDISHFTTGVVIAYGVPLIYGKDIFANVDDIAFQGVTAIPKDVAGNESVVTYENLGDTVFLYVEGDIQ